MTESLPLATFARLLRRKNGLLGSVLLSVVCLAALLAPVISPYDPDTMHAQDRIQFMNQKYLLGTDMYGRDILSRIIWGARVSIYVGLISVSIGLAVGIPLGLVAGYRGGLIDEVIMRIMDSMMAFPAILLALVIVAVLGFSIQNLMVAIGTVYIPEFARVVRGSVLSAREKNYVEASRSCGDSDSHIMFKEILPNCAAPLIVQTTINFAYAILYEAFLSFLGLGVQPPTPAWGYMLNEARDFLTAAPWMAVFPGLAIFFTVLSFNLFGDALRDILDPRFQTG